MECLEYNSSICLGPVEYRMPLSATGISYPRCNYHWNLRLVEQERINETYGSYDSDCPPDWYSYDDIGEYWDDDY